MKELLKGFRLNLTLSAVLTVLLGLLLIFWPGTILTTIARLISVALIVSGAVMLLGILVGERRGLLGGIVVLALGLWSLGHSQTIVSILPMVAGVLMIVHAVQEVGLAIEARAMKQARWPWALCVAALTAIFGLICIFHGFGVVSLIVSIIGGMLVWDGLTDMIVVHRVSKATREAIIDGEVVEEEII